MTKELRSVKFNENPQYSQMVSDVLKSLSDCLPDASFQEGIAIVSHALGALIAAQDGRFLSEEMALKLITENVKEGMKHTRRKA